MWVFKWLPCTLLVSVSERFNLPYFLPSIYNSVIVLLHFDSTKWSHLHTLALSLPAPLMLSLPHTHTNTHVSTYFLTYKILCGSNASAHKNFLSSELNGWKCSVGCQKWPGAWRRSISELWHRPNGSAESYANPALSALTTCPLSHLPPCQGWSRGFVPADSWDISAQTTGTAAHVQKYGMRGRDWADVVKSRSNRKGPRNKTVVFNGVVIDFSVM